MKKPFDNENRTRYYGLRKGDIVNLNGMNGAPGYQNAEVIDYGVMDNNRVFVRRENGEETDWVAEWCKIVTKVEDRIPKVKNLDLKNADFRKYYDTEQKRNYWVLGYFGGGPVGVVDAMRLGKEYSEVCGVPIETVKIDEVLHSQRFKGFKFLFSTVEQEICDGCTHIMNNVFGWLTD
jgi:hypothetical protein